LWGPSLLVAGVTLGITIGAASWAHARNFVVPAQSSAATGNASDAQVRTAVETALRTHQTLPVPSNGIAAATAAGPSETDLQKEVVSAQAAAANAFGSNLSKKELRALDASIAMQRGGNFRALAAGIKNLNIRSISYDAAGTTAVVTGTVETWSRVELKNPDGTWRLAEPHNSINFTMTIADENHWVAETFDWSFVPGSAP
jgi:hypothetical protein